MPNRSQAIETALRDLWDAVWTAIGQTPRMSFATRTVLEDRLEEARAAINLPDGPPS